MAQSVYDKINLATDVIEEEFDKKKLEESMTTLSDIEDTLVEMEEDMEKIYEKYKYEELKMSDFREFFEDTLPDMVGILSKTRERLY